MYSPSRRSIPLKPKLTPQSKYVEDRQMSSMRESNASTALQVLIDPFPISVIFTLYRALTTPAKRQLRDSMFDLVHGPLDNNSPYGVSSRQQRTGSTAFGFIEKGLETQFHFRILPVRPTSSMANRRVSLTRTSLAEVTMQTHELRTGLTQLQRESALIKLKELRTLTRSEEQNSLVGTLLSLRCNAERHLPEHHRNLLLACCRVFILHRSSINEEHGFMKWRLVNQLCSEFCKVKLGKLMEINVIIDKLHGRWMKQKLFEHWKPYGMKEEDAKRRRALMLNALSRLTYVVDLSYPATAFLKWRLEALTLRKAEDRLAKLPWCTLRFLDSIYPCRFTNHLQECIVRKAKQLNAREKSPSLIASNKAISDSVRLRNFIDAWLEKLHDSLAEFKHRSCNTSVRMLCLTFKQLKREETCHFRASSELKGSYRLRCWYTNWIEYTRYKRSCAESKAEVMGFMATEIVTKAVHRRKRNVIRKLDLTRLHFEDKASWLSRTMDKLMRTKCYSLRAMIQLQVDLLRYNRVNLPWHYPYAQLTCKDQSKADSVPTLFNRSLGHFEITLTRCFATWSYATNLSKTLVLNKGLVVRSIVRDLLRRRLNRPFKQLTTYRSHDLRALLRCYNSRCLAQKQHYFYRLKSSPSSMPTPASHYSALHLLMSVTRRVTKAAMVDISRNRIREVAYYFMHNLLNKIKELKQASFSRWHTALAQDKAERRANKLVYFIGGYSKKLKDALLIWRRQVTSQTSFRPSFFTEPLEIVTRANPDLELERPSSRSSHGSQRSTLSIFPKLNKSFQKILFNI